MIRLAVLIAAAALAQAVGTSSSSPSAGAPLSHGGEAKVRGAPSSGVALEGLLAETPAPTLGAYRLFTDAGGRIPNLGLTPYGLNTPLFSDYAEKARYLYLPPGLSATYRASGVLAFPVGATLVKTFAYPADLRRPNDAQKLIETRLLIHRRQGWVALTYVWNDQQTEATLKRAGGRVAVQVIDKQGRLLDIDYAVPNQNQCKQCHGLSGVLTPIGPKARNLNGDFAYGGGRENQLAHWRKTGILKGAPAATALPRTAVWDDPREPILPRGRAYLDANCAHCHNPKGAASNTGLFLNLEETGRTAQGIGKHPVAAGQGSGELKLDIDPGHPEASILLYRMQSRTPGVMMPELSRSLTHAEGVALITAYLKALPTTH